MTDENTPQEGQQEPVEFTPVQEQALSSGWVPKEDFKGDPDKWVDAAEFLRRGELFSKIEHQNRELKEMRRTIEAMAQHHAKVSEVEYKRALETLKQQKKTALEEGDADLVIAVDEQIDAVRELRRNAPAVEMAPEPAQEHPEFVQWKSQNPWYETTAHMRVFADNVGERLHAQGMSPAEVLRRVAEEVRKEFPTKFTNPRQSRPSSVEGSQARGSGSSSFQLTAEERKIMNTLVRQNVLTEEQYIADLKKIKGV